MKTMIFLRNGFTLLILFLLFCNSCNNQEYVIYKPHYLSSNGNLKYFGEEKLSMEEKSNLIQVLEYYGIDFKETKDQKIMIPKKINNDWNLVWNFTTKSNDKKWLKGHKN